MRDNRYAEQCGLGRHVMVYFSHDKTVYPAIIVRNDMTSPRKTLFMLHDGRILSAGECWSRDLTDEEEKLYPMPVSVKITFDENGISIDEIKHGKEQI